MTEFQDNVYRLVSAIPKGKVTTYKQLSLCLNGVSAQAIGQALKRNPNAPAIPCHRVIKSDLSLGGYFGQIEGEKTRQKRKLLLQEGVFFTAAGKLKDPSRLFLLR